MRRLHLIGVLVAGLMYASAGRAVDAPCGADLVCHAGALLAIGVGLTRKKRPSAR